MDLTLACFIFFTQRLLAARPDAQLVMASEREGRILLPNGRMILLLQAFDLSQHEVQLWVHESLRRFDEKGMDFIVFHPGFELENIQADLKSHSSLRNPMNILLVNARGESVHSAGMWWFRKYVKQLKLSLLDVQKQKSAWEAEKIISKRLHADLDKVGNLMKFQESFSMRPYPATIALAAFVAFLYLLEEWWGGSSSTRTLFVMGANVKGLSSQPWRLITSIFLHSGFAHVFFNTYVLVVLGKFFNQLFGNAKFFCLFLIAGISGSLASFALGAGDISVGASGGLWGLFGASAALIIRPSPLLPDLLRERIKRITIINLVLNLAVSFLPMIDIWAHLGGGVGGFFMGLIFVSLAQNPQNQTGKKASAWDIAAILGVFLVLACFTKQFSTYTPWILLS